MMGHKHNLKLGQHDFAPRTCRLHIQRMNVSLNSSRAYLALSFARWSPPQHRVPIGNSTRNACSPETLPESPKDTRLANSFLKSQPCLHQKVGCFHPNMFHGRRLKFVKGLLLKWITPTMLQALGRLSRRCVAISGLVLVFVVLACMRTIQPPLLLHLLRPLLLLLLLLLVFFQTGALKNFKVFNRDQLLSS